MPVVPCMIAGVRYVLEYNVHDIKEGRGYVGKLSSDHMIYFFSYRRTNSGEKEITPLSLPAFIKQAVMDKIDGG